MRGPHNDWVEGVRAWLWPKLNWLLRPFKVKTVGIVGEEQYVATLDMGEEELEEHLAEYGFLRNPMAYYKETRNGRKSEGSWFLVYGKDQLGILDEDRQLHVTLFDAVDGKGIDVYAHEEYDWRTKPDEHYREVDFAPEVGADKMERVLEDMWLLDYSIT